ncbi:MAG: leucine-rich repeat domain-containing protein [Prevotellaceae bacterium]|jgi:hypothetical protein|nr:leucine-rich repeat domain-containing protein [Prevotellaceae bacterium]
MKTNTSITVTLTANLRLEQALEQALKQAGVKKPREVTKLTIYGTLTADDFQYIRKKMGKTLLELDLGNASIEGNKIPNLAITGSSLNSLTIPDSVTEIDISTLKFCLTTITVGSQNLFFTSEDGVLFNKAKTELIRYPRERKEGCYIIPDSVTKIGDNAFYLADLCSVFIPDSVTTIGRCAFSSSDLTSITIPDSVTEIGNGAFTDCEELMSIIISNSVRKIGRDTFYGCSGLISITIPNLVTEIGPSAFLNCYRLTSITIPDSVIKIDRFAFKGCNLSSISIPASVTEIESFAFDECINLTTITVHPNNQVYTSIDGVLFDKAKRVLVQYPIGRKEECYVIPDSVTIIGAGTFSNCYRLTSVTIPDSVIEIEFYAFLNCACLPTLYIPNPVAEISEFAFERCPAFVTVHPDNPKYKSENGRVKEK